MGKEVNFFGNLFGNFFKIISIFLGGVILAWYNLCKSPEELFKKDFFLTLEELELDGGLEGKTGGLQGGAGGSTRWPAPSVGERRLLFV